MEMQQLQKAGLSLAQIFRAATISNAREFKLDSQLGTIEPGRIANFVMLKKSPLENADAYDSITTVWVHGNPISRDSLAVNSATKSVVWARCYCRANQLGIRLDWRVSWFQTTRRRPVLLSEHTFPDGWW
jgi:adenine deaminase